MRISLFILLAFALFAQAAYAETKLAPKLTKITGYGEYKLGTPISQYDVSRFSRQEDKLFIEYIPEGTALYSLKTMKVFAIEGQHIKVTFLLRSIIDKLDNVTICTFHLEDYFSDAGSMAAFIQKLRLALLAKYSQELIVRDDYASWDWSWNPITKKTLMLKDADGNSILLDIVIGEYSTILFLEYRSAYFTRLMEKAEMEWASKLSDEDDRHNL